MGCDNLIITANDILNLTGTSNLHNAFRDCTSIVNIPNANLWDVSKVTDMGSMFYHCEFFNESIEDWNVSNVTDMGFMFSGCYAFNSHISRWNVSNVIYMTPGLY